MRPLFLSLILTIIGISSPQLPIPDSQYRVVRTVAVTLPAAINPSCQVLGAVGGTTTPIDTTGANFLSVSVSHSAPPATLTDSKSNTWACLPEYNAVGRDQICYSENPTVGTGHTFTYAQVSDFSSICILPLSGMKTSSVYDTGKQSGNATGGATCQPGSFTPTSGVTVVITTAMEKTTDAGAYTINSGYTIDGFISGGAGVNYGNSIAHLVQTPDGVATNPTWGNFTSSGCAIAAFKAQ